MMPRRVEALLPRPRCIAVVTGRDEDEGVLAKLMTADNSTFLVLLVVEDIELVLVLITPVVLVVLMDPAVVLVLVLVVDGRLLGR